MRDYGEFQEIENWGEEPEQAEKEPFTESGGNAGGGSFLSILQVILCVAALLSLAVLKATDTEMFGKAVSWYRSEAAKEIELPEWRKGETGDPASSAVSKAAVEIPGDGIVQEI